MKRISFLRVLLLGSIAACTPVTAKVFLRVEASPLPPADKTGIQDVVLLWPLRDPSVAAKLHSQGYRVFLQCESKDLAAVVATADRAAVTGMIVTNTVPSSQFHAAERLHPYFAAHKSLTFRMLVPGGKQSHRNGRETVVRDPRAWTLWKGIMPYLDFSSHAATERMLPVANLGVIVDDGQASYEAINLMARHNLAFESVRPSGVTLARLSSWNSVVVFCP